MPSLAGRTPDLGIEYKGLAVGDASFDIELDDGTFDLIVGFVLSPERDDLFSEIYGEHIEIFGCITFPHYRTECAVELGHKAVHGPPHSFHIGYFLEM